MSCCSSTTHNTHSNNQQSGCGSQALQDETASTSTIKSSHTVVGDKQNSGQTPRQQPQQQQKQAIPRTFYRRPLPDVCIALSSSEGKARFASAMTHQGLKSFFTLMEQFTTQTEPAFCGISTLVIVLNALAVDPRRTWKGPWRWYEESMLNCCLNLETIKETGITIQDFQCLAICQGLAVEVVLVQDIVKEGVGEEEQGLNQFRQAIRRACVAPLINDSQENNTDNITKRDEILVVSYSRKALSQTGSGHFSPVAAYDAESDSVLVLDTARFKYGAHWVSVPLLFNALKPLDSTTGKSRGYILLSNHDGQPTTLNHDDSSELLPSLLPSVLFRSQRRDNPVRREYKEHLSATKVDPKEEDDSATTNTGIITLDQVISFWTKDGTKPSHVWKMMEPQFTPLQEDEPALALVDSVRSLVDLLLRRVPHTTPPKSCCECRVNYGRTLDMSPLEAIFVVYLASIDKIQRQELVLSVNGEHGKDEFTPAQAQLLAEADLIQHAIEMSDKL